MAKKLRIPSHHIEIRLAEYLSSIEMSARAAYADRGQTSLTEAQAYNATFQIVRAETAGIEAFRDSIKRSGLRKKHATFLSYTHQYYAWLQTFPENIVNDEKQLVRFCRGLVVMLSDLHTILIEDTKQEYREEALKIACSSHFNCENQKDN